jgi:hypothetical protein
MCLAKYCNVEDPPEDDLRWVKPEPDDCEEAIAFALRRQGVEAFGPDPLYSEALGAARP